MKWGEEMQMLERLRMEKGYTQEMMAKRLSIATSTYFQYEKGQRLIPRSIVEEIASILQIPQEEIFLPVKFTICKNGAGESEKEAG